MLVGEHRKPGGQLGCGRPAAAERGPRHGLGRQPDVGRERPVVLARWHAAASTHLLNALSPIQQPYSKRAGSCLASPSPASVYYRAWPAGSCFFCVYSIAASRSQQASHKDVGNRTCIFGKMRISEALEDHVLQRGRRVYGSGHDRRGRGRGRRGSGHSPLAFLAGRWCARRCRRHALGGNGRCRRTQEYGGRPRTHGRRQRGRRRQSGGARNRQDADGRRCGVRGHGRCARPRQGRALRMKREHGRCDGHGRCRDDR